MASRLEAWETPFRSASWPSVWVETTPFLKDSSVYVKADQCFELKFENILGIKVSDESYDMNTRFHIERNRNDTCSYIWRESPWLNEFNGEYAEGMEGGSLNHYVLLGGDYNLEVLAIGEVEIAIVPDEVIVNQNRRTP